MACCLLLSSCGESTSPDDNFSTNARDFLFAGNVGTEIVLAVTRSEIDTNGVKTISPVDTLIWTIMERNVPHPVGGSAIRIREENRRGVDTIRYSLDSTYYAFYNDGIAYFSSLNTTNSEMIIKNPLTVGAQYTNGDVGSGDNRALIVKSVGEIVNTSYKQMKTVRIESQDSSVSNSIIYKESMKYYFAPEVLVAHAERINERIYPSKKKRTQMFVTDLVRYTKK